MHGEHSVVYGKLAVAAALGLRTTVGFVEIEQTSDFAVDLPVDLSHKYNLQVSLCSLTFSKTTMSKMI